MLDADIPNEALRAVKAIIEVLGNEVLGVYLYGSAAAGGLRVNSDVDVLVIV